MLTDKFGFNMLKDSDGSSLDVSAFFNRLFGIYKNDIVEFPPQMEKWLSMDFEKIDKSETYQILPIRWRIEILEHIMKESRFNGNQQEFELEIVKLRKLEERQIRNNIYTETFELVLKSKKEAVINIHEWQSKTKRLITQSLTDSKDLKQLWEERCDYLQEFENWVKHSYFEVEGDNIAQVTPIQSASPSETTIEPMEIKDIEEKNSLSSRLVMMHELGLYDQLKKRMDETTGYIRKDMARLIAYIFGVQNVKYINDFLTDPNLSPFYTNYNDPQKDNPYTRAAIKKMKQMLRDCNLEPKGEYKENKEPEFASPKKK